MINTLTNVLRAALKQLKRSKDRTHRMNKKNISEFSNMYEHEKMLADTVRVESYRQAIRRHIGPGDVVVDLGTGTGILSLFAARQHPARIYAIDHSEFIEVAHAIAERNGIDTITFVKTNSQTFTPTEQVDVILHEQMGDHLFDENMVANILDMKRRILKESGRILPGRFEVYLEPVAIKKEYRVPFLWENDIEGIDLSFLKASGITDRYQRADYGKCWLEPAALEAFLCEPAPLLVFDLNELREERDLPRVLHASRRVVNPGFLDGFCFYFRVIFDDETGFDTSPAHHPRTHWGNRLFRNERWLCAPGDTLSWRLTMGDLLNIRSWSISVTPN